MTFDDKTWMIGDCQYKSPSEPYGVHCSPARKSTWRSMAVLHGSAGEHRLYRFGGSYAGQGGGINHYLLFIGDHHVVVHSEEADSDTAPFEGNGVTARLLRSIRGR